MPVENMIGQRRRLLSASEKHDVLRLVFYLAEDSFNAFKIGQDEQCLPNRLIINRSQPELHSELLHRVPVHQPATAQRAETFRDLFHSHLPGKMPVQDSVAGPVEDLLRDTEHLVGH